MSTSSLPELGASLAAIQRHYDVGNGFYRLWLDESQTYSCALWEEGDTLESAQLRKLRFHISEVGAAGKERVLDIGCGWGSLLLELVRRSGVAKAVGLTLSARQADYVGSLGDRRIEVRLEGWQEHEPELPYDAIISIGAFEHFAKLGLDERQKLAVYRSFFARCHNWLRPGGRLSLQSIVYGNATSAHFSPFFANEIFPESDLPRVHEIARACDGLFEILGVRGDRPDYERTAEEWRRRFKAQRAAAVAKVGEEQVVRFEKYLHQVIIAFHIGTMGLTRWTLSRLDTSRIDWRAA